jgi:hypothetical protein
MGCSLDAPSVHAPRSRRHCPPGLVAAVAASALVSRRRSFLKDARACAATLCPPLQVYDDTRPDELEKPFGPDCPKKLLVAFNHYTRPGFPAWWTVFALGAALIRVGLAQPEPRWVITAGLNYLGLLAPLSRWALRRIASVYDTFLMPTMPPNPKDMEARAAAVRQVITFARNTPNARVCLAPEGYDNNDGRLIVPPPGAGRFLLQLCHAGMTILPAGVCAEGGVYHVRFGSTFSLDMPQDVSPDARDEWASRRVMRAIAELLPQRLRGPFVS